MVKSMLGKRLIIEALAPHGNQAALVGNTTVFPALRLSLPSLQLHSETCPLQLKFGLTHLTPQAIMPSSFNTSTHRLNGFLLKAILVV